jgi:hypothetical protein
MKISITRFASAYMSPLLKASIIAPSKLAKMGKDAPMRSEPIVPATIIILSLLSVNLNKEEKSDLTFLS